MTSLCGQSTPFHRVSTLTRDIDITILSVRPSIRLSVSNALVSDENGLTYCHSFSLYGTVW